MTQASIRMTSIVIIVLSTFTSIEAKGGFLFIPTDGSGVGIVLMILSICLTLGCCICRYACKGNDEPSNPEERNMEQVWDFLVSIR